MIDRGATPPFTVEPVLSRRDFNDFLLLPRDIYRSHPNWVHPLISEQKKTLDPTRNPSLESSAYQLFLARRNGKAVGRVMASHSGGEEGKFGFFECIQDDPIARSLFNRCREWLRARGVTKCLGPFNPTIHDECGVLVDGFESPPTILTSYHPPHYDALLRNVGLTPAMDFLGYHMETRTPIPDRVKKIVMRTRDRTGVQLRNLDLGRFDEEAELLRQLYNGAWADNWGFEPLSPEEFGFIADGLRQIVNPEFVLIASIDHEPVGFSLSLPDVNQALHHIEGRLFPFGLIKLLSKVRSINRIRVVALGILPPYQKRGIDALLYLETYERGEKNGIISGEFSWVLEHNVPMNQALLALGATVSKRWRIYELPMDQGQASF